MLTAWSSPARIQWWILFTLQPYLFASCGGENVLVTIHPLTAYVTEDPITPQPESAGKFGDGHAAGVVHALPPLPGRLFLEVDGRAAWSRRLASRRRTSAAHLARWR